jgi:hypothetical protein
VFNRDGHVQARDPFALFPKLKLLQDDAPHAFYMGVELAKAQIAWQLGKRYSQDEELDWGAATAKTAAEEQAERTRAAHALKPENAKPADDYKQAGATLEASRERRRKRKAS